jgi:hypothetical protein
MVRGRCRTRAGWCIGEAKRAIVVKLIRADMPPLTVDEFDARFERARPRVLAVARAIVGASPAEDIVQETYLVAIPDGAAAGWAATG